MSREMSKKQIHKHSRNRQNPRYAQRGFIDKDRALKSTHRDQRDQETLQVDLSYGVKIH